MQILYFAWLKTKVGCGSEDLSLPSSVVTVQDLAAWLATRSAGHAAAFADLALLRVAVDQEHCDWNHPLAQAQEVAFFPPVTGG